MSLPLKVARASDVFGDTSGDENLTKGGSRIFNMTHLIRPSVKVDHRKELEQTARELEGFRSRIPKATDSVSLAELKMKVASASTVREMVCLLRACEEGMKEMGQKVEGRCFQELLSIGAADGPLPLSEWPNDRSKNWFAQVVRFAQKFSPVTLSLLLRLTVHSEEENIGVRHVVSLASFYGLLAAQVDRTNNVLCKLNTLQLRWMAAQRKALMRWLSWESHTRLAARHLRRQRDVIAEVADAIRIEETKHHPDQSTLDNCNQKESDTTVEYRQTETIDTRSFNTDPKTPEEVMDLFGIELLDVTSPQLSAELSHLEKIVGLVVSRAVSKDRPELAHVYPLLPRHHKHSQSHPPLEEAKLTLVSPHYYKVG